MDLFLLLLLLKPSLSNSHLFPTQENRRNTMRKRQWVVLNTPDQVDQVTLLTPPTRPTPNRTPNSRNHPLSQVAHIPLNSRNYPNYESRTRSLNSRNYPRRSSIMKIGGVCHFGAPHSRNATSNGDQPATLFAPPVHRAHFLSKRESLNSPSVFHSQAWQRAIQWGTVKLKKKG